MVPSIRALAPKGPSVIIFVLLLTSCVTLGALGSYFLIRNVGVIIAPISKGGGEDQISIS